MLRGGDVTWPPLRQNDSCYQARLPPFIGTRCSIVRPCSPIAGIGVRGHDTVIMFCTKLQNKG